MDMYSASRGLTISSVHVEHLLHDIQLFVPVRHLPPMRLSFGRAVWYVLKAPSAVVPYPVYLRMVFEQRGGQIQIVREQCVDLCRFTTFDSESAAKRLKEAVYLLGNISFNSICRL